MLLQTHHKHFLHSGNALAKYGAKLISYTSQKEAEQRYPQQSIDDTEDPSTLRVGRDVPKTCRDDRKKKRLRNVLLFHAELRGKMIRYNKATGETVCLRVFARVLHDFF